MLPSGREPIAAAVASVALVAASVVVGRAGIAGSRSRWRLRRRSARRDFVDETAASGVDHTYDGDFAVLRRRRRRRLRLRRRRPARPVLRRRQPAGRPVSQRERGRRRAALRGRRRRGDRPRRRVSAPTRSTSMATACVDLLVLRDGENVAAARPRRLPLRARQRALGVRRRRRCDDRLQRDAGRRRDSLPTLAFGNYLDRRRLSDPDHLCADNQLVRPRRRRGEATTPPLPLTPALVHAVDAVQRLGPVRAARPAGQQRPPLLQRPERRPGAALADRRRARRRASTPPPTAGRRSGSRAWASPATTSPATAIPTST